MKKKTTVYTADSDIRSVGRLFREMLEGIKNGRELAWRLFRRNISARYRQSFLGVMWAFIPTIASTVMWVLLQKSQIFNIEETTIPYPVYVMVGTILWGVFTQSINAPINIVKASKSMISKINFPREALLMTAFGDVVFAFLIKAVTLIFLFYWFEIVPGWTILLFFAGVLLIILLGMAIGLVIMPFAMLIDDVQSMLSGIMGIWFFLTPIVYPVPKDGIAALLATYNPISPLLIATRDWLTVGEATMPAGFWIVVVVMLVFLTFGLLLYKVAMPHIIERIGA